MKNRRYLTLTLLALGMLAFLPISFAQEDVIVEPEAEAEVFDEPEAEVEVFDELVVVPVAEDEVFDEGVTQEDVEVNTSAYVVRLIYFLPNDRQAQPDIDAKLDARIKKAQQLLADAMEQHGYGRKTFRFESDENGNAVVHRVNGLHNDAYYQHEPSGKILAETNQQFDYSKNVYFISVEISSDEFDAGAACGYGGDIGYGGQVVVPASGSCFEGAPLDGVDLAAHELAHAFGLQHNFRNFNYIMSYGWGRTELAPCEAEWLNAHPYFNPDKVITRNHNTRINLLSSEFEATPPHALRLRFEINDPDRLQQAQLLTHATGASVASGHPELVDCKTLSDGNETVEFVTTEILNDVWIYVIDKEGNYSKRRFDVDFRSLSPDSDVVDIPDANLAAAIRVEFDYTPGKQITKFDMARLPYLHAADKDIRDLTGLEHAVGLKLLNVGGNPIRDLTPILALPQLRLLYLGDTAINDLKQVAELTHLTHLGLGSNQLSDLRPLAALTQLTELRLGSNQISDLRPLAALTQLTKLNLSFNQISNIIPLENMRRLEDLNLQHNQISDISPLRRLVRLKWLYIDSNPLIADITSLENMTQMRFLQISNPLITDITPLSGLTELVELGIIESQVRDISPLANMTQLRALNIHTNPLTDITPLSGLTELVELGLASCQIRDISPLAALTRLESVGLSNNQISDITPVGRLTKVKALSLANNQISNVRPLIGLVNLNELWIWGNPIIDREPLFTLLRRNPKIQIYHQHGGEPLPVTLSSFKAVRAADGVVLKWTTESELNNAGFNILRSRTQTGDFKQVNAKLIQGAGTTSERTTYTWSDTTAKPNTLYYYRIEDISHAGKRKTLGTVRLRGLVSATDKLLTKWSDLKRL